MNMSFKGLLSVVLAAGLVLSGASGALAIGAGSGSGGDNTNPAPSNPGTTTPVTPQPSEWVWHSISWVEWQEVAMAHIPNTCDSVRESDGAPLLGATVRWQQNRETKAMRNTSILCHYPPSYAISNVTCVLSSNVTIEMVAPSRKTLGTKTVSTSYASAPTLPNCDGSASAVYMETQPQEFGRYRAFASTQVQYCQKKTWATETMTGRTAPAELVNCGAPRTINPSAAQGELSCEGWIDSWTARSDWSEAACGSQTSQNPTYQCVIPADGTQDEVLRSGSSIPVRFGAPGVAGGSIRAVGAGSTLLEAPLAAGTAQSRLADVFSGSRSALKASGETTGWLPGIRTEWDAVLYVAEPLSMTSTYQWDVTVAKTGVQFVSVNPATGAWVTQPVEVLVDTVARCTDSITIDGLRVVNF